MDEAILLVFGVAGAVADTGGMLGDALHAARIMTNTTLVVSIAQKNRLISTSVIPGLGLKHPRSSPIANLQADYLVQW